MNLKKIFGFLIWVIIFLVAFSFAKNWIKKPAKALEDSFTSDLNTILKLSYQDAIRRGIIRSSVTYMDGGRSVRLTMNREPVENKKVHVILKEGTMTLDIIRPPATVRISREMDISFAAEDSASVILPVIK